MHYKFKTKPYQHQLNALARSWDKEYFAYFMEMGTGKSKVLVDNIAMLYDKGKINGALIIAPKVLWAHGIKTKYLHTCQIMSNIRQYYGNLTLMLNNRRS